MEKKKVYVLIKMLCKEENKENDAERVAFIFFNTSALDEIRRCDSFLNRGTPRTFSLGQ